MLTPLDVRKKEFRRCFRGYDEQEVDRFLDLVIDTMERLIEQKNGLQEQLERMEGMVARYTELEDVLKSTMVIAQQTANEIKEAAERQVNSMLKEAGAKSDQILTRARTEGKALLNQAHQDAARVMDEASRKADRIMEDYGVLQKQAGLFRNKFRSFLEVQLEMLDSDLGVPDDYHQLALTDAVAGDADVEWEDYDLTEDDEAEGAAADIPAVVTEDEAAAEGEPAAGMDVSEGKERLA